MSEERTVEERQRIRAEAVEVLARLLRSVLDDQGNLLPERRKDSAA